MKRKNLLFCLFLMYISAALVLSLWAGRVWGASGPNLTLEVKGVTTEADVAPTQPSLAPYPITASPVYSINAKEYALYNPESGKLLLQSSTMEPVPIASTTKLMTTTIVSHIGKMDDLLTISPEAATQTGSLMNLTTGEEITVQNLLYGALLVSGNDAAYALAEYGGGLLLNNPNATSEARIARFVKEMNSQAADLHMENTHYLDPVGLNDGGHSTAFDLAKLASQVIENPILKKIIATSDITVGSHVLHNSDRLLSDAPYDGILGGKTGFTPDAGHCLVAAARRGNETLIAVILHTDADNTEASAIEARKLLDAGFTSTHWE